ncbi:MAG: hypothetical protein ABUS47_16270 [Steroidobacter sp.]
MNFKKVAKIASVVLALLSFQAAFAWDGSVVGTVLQFDVVTAVGDAPHNYAFRVYLTGRPAMCTGNVNGDNSWAYINSDEANYNTLVAAIMMARSTDTRVRIYSKIDSGGYCHLGYVMVNPPY